MYAVSCCYKLYALEIKNAGLWSMFFPPNSEVKWVTGSDIILTVTIVSYLLRK